MILLNCVTAFWYSSRFLIWLLLLLIWIILGPNARSMCKVLHRARIRRPLYLHRRIHDEAILFYRWVSVENLAASNHEILVLVWYLTRPWNNHMLRLSLDLAASWQLCTLQPLFVWPLVLIRITSLRIHQSTAGLWSVLWWHIHFEELFRKCPLSLHSWVFSQCSLVLFHFSFASITLALFRLILDLQLALALQLLVINVKIFTFRGLFVLSSYPSGVQHLHSVLMRRFAVGTALLIH